jgi:hypothetical protein
MSQDLQHFTTTQNELGNSLLQQHRYSAFYRLMGMVCGLLLGGFFLTAIVLAVVEAMTGPQSDPTEWSVGLVLLVAFIFTWTAFWLFTGVSAYWLGRLELYEERALLPRIGLAPWSYLPLHELPLTQVIRWGVGMQRVRSGSVAVLMIEAPHSSQEDRKVVRRIALSMYPQESRQQIVEYFAARLDQPTELQSGFGGLAFPKSE